MAESQTTKSSDELKDEPLLAMASILYDIASPDGQKTVGRLMDRLQAKQQEEEHQTADKLTSLQRACLACYEPDASWACVQGVLIVVRPGAKKADIIDTSGRYRRPLWLLRSDLSDGK